MIRRRASRARRDASGPESLRDALLRDQPLPPSRSPPSLDRAGRDPRTAYRRDSRAGLAALLVIIEGGALAAALLLASAWQATAPALALPAQARGLASLTEVDALITLRSADLQRQLDQGTDALTLADFPVRGLAIDRSEAESAQGTFDPTAYREALLEAGVSRLYERGLDALRSPDSPATASDRLIEVFVNGLTSQRHTQATVALAIAGGAVVLIGLLQALLARGFRWLALSLSLATGGAFALMLTLLARGALATLNTPPDAALSEYVAIARALLDLAQSNALAALALGLTLTLPALVIRRRR